MFIESLLDDPNNSHLLFTSGESKKIVIGVPHHAPLGISKLPCKDHPDADENTGFLGYYVSRLINCPSIIACNYFLDPNKDKETDYCKKILSMKPKLLIEIHGHGGHKAKFDIEISSGSLENDLWSKELAERLRASLSGIPALQGYTLSGDFNEIYFQAKNSFSITTKEWIAFHIELPISIRQSKSQYIPFCELLAKTANGLLTDFDKILKSQLRNAN
jgi:hypothetical protein